MRYGIPEDYYHELSDLYHYTEWSIRKEAANAADSTNTPYATGEALFWYVRSIMHYVSNDLTYNYALSDIKIIDEGYIGVCDEYATLFVTLSKGLELPARELRFCISNGPDHALAEFWDGNRWVHADSAMGLFDSPRYYQEYYSWDIDHVYIKYGADDTKWPFEGPSDDGILYLRPYYVDGTHNSQDYGDILHWVTYSDSPYQWW